MNLKLLLVACVSVVAAVDNEEPCKGLGGNCVDIHSHTCRPQHQRRGKCPTQPSHVKCCLAYQENACRSVGGQCQRDDLPCTGNYRSGKCPTQPGNVRCCVDSSSSSHTHSGPCALVEFRDPVFTGKKLIVDREFLPALRRIRSHAESAGVKLHITSSFRTSTKVSGAIVTPAKKSNHLAGHAIDMNVKYGARHSSLCNSSCLRGASPPTAVKRFLDLCREDSVLRWGGDFRTKDPVHIDDGLNIRNPSNWERRFRAAQQAHGSCLDRL